jgi:hypothetical protein
MLLVNNDSWNYRSALFPKFYDYGKRAVPKNVARQDDV